MKRQGRQHYIRLAAFFAATLLSSAAFAQVTPEDTETPRGLAMGSGARASAVSTSALTDNPANIALSRAYHIEATTGYSPSLHVLSFGSAIVDSVTSRLAMGFSFRGLVGTNTGSYGGVDGRMGFAAALSDMLSLGLAGRYVRIQDKATQDMLIERFSLDASIRVTAFSGLNIAALGQNLIPTHSLLAPTLVGGSLSYSLDGAFSLNADLLFNVSPDTPGAPMRVGGGVEYLAGGSVPLRAGYYYDEIRRTHVATGGIGYVDQRMGVDFGLRQDVQPHSATYMMIGIRYFVQ